MTTAEARPAKKSKKTPPEKPLPVALSANEPALWACEAALLMVFDCHRRHFSQNGAHWLDQLDGAQCEGEPE